jgi:MFS family permease
MVISDNESYDKSKSPLRWLILVLACLMLIGSYYCFDIPASCKTQLDDFMGDPKEYETYFSLFYTLYSTPNTILPFFGGYFVDMFGVRTCLLVFTSLIMLGQIIFAFGLSIKSWPILFLGRLVFGLGGESLIVANSALLAGILLDL